MRHSVNAFLQKFNPIEMNKKRILQKNLRTKIEHLQKNLAAMEPFTLETLPTFFNKVEASLGEIQQSEWQVSPLFLISVRDTAVRGSSFNNCYRTEGVTEATPLNTFCKPREITKEYHPARTVHDLLQMNDIPTKKTGRSSKPISTKDFYEKSAVYFMKKIYDLIKRSATELS